MRNVGITGMMGSGKSSIAAVLVGAGYTKVSFAEPLKSVASLAYGTVDKSKDYEVVDRDGMVKKISGRQVLQQLGQSIKSMDNLFWTRVLLNSADQMGVPLVVDDLRFSHELQSLRERGWIIVGLLCPDSVRIERLTAVNGREPTPEELNHASETEVPALVASSDLQVDSTLDPYYNAKRILELARKE